MFPEEVEGALGSPLPLGGLPRFEHCVFETAFPYGRVTLRDDHAPLDAVVEAWSVFVPGDDEASGLPVAVLRVTLQSKCGVPLDASVMFSVEDMVGHRLRAPGMSAGTSVPQVELKQGAGISGVVLGDAGMGNDDEEWGTIAAGVLGEQAFPGVPWSVGKWNQGLSTMWEGFVCGGLPEEGTFEPAPGEPQCTCIGARRQLPPLGQATVTFLLGWHFPNRHAWTFTGRAGEGLPKMWSATTTARALAMPGRSWSGSRPSSRNWSDGRGRSWKHSVPPTSAQQSRRRHFST